MITLFYQLLLAVPIMAVLDAAIITEPNLLYSFSQGVVSMMISMAWIKLMYH